MDCCALTKEFHMAATYEKFTLDTFKKKMKKGGYKDLGGARRAIGRMSEWTEAERDKARAAAAKFFGGEAPKKAAKKTAKKATAKKTAKKVASKKATKKAAKKSAKKTTVKKKVTGRARAKRKPADPPVMERIQQQKLRIGTISEALNAMRTAKELGATATEVQEGAKVAQKGLTSSVNELCRLTTEAVSEPAADGGNSQGTLDALDRAHAAAVAPQNALGTPAPEPTPS
jgi:hypothetical protein